MRGRIDKRVTPNKRVTSPYWDAPPLIKQILSNRCEAALSFFNSWPPNFDVSISSYLETVGNFVSLQLH